MRYTLVIGNLLNIRLSLILFPFALAFLTP